jgi:hypothetical protein
MLAATIWVDAGVESHVRTVVVVDDGARFVSKEDGLRVRIVRFVPLGCLVGYLFESISWIAGRTSSTDFHENYFIISTHDFICRL